MLGFSWLALTGCQTVKNRLDSPNRLSAANNRPTITRNEVSHQNRTIELANSPNATQPDTNVDAEIARVAYRPQLDDNLSPVRLEPPTPDSQASAITDTALDLQATDANVGNER
ncbi:MAG: hypothetical protein KDA87_10435, partial [Planctomycetales bacterium]|nr:hypothetical protein [Planctomycetales bacterium]